MHPIVDDVGTIKQWAGIPNIWRLRAGVTKGIDHREKILQQAARIPHVSDTVIQKEPCHGVGKAAIKGEVNMKIPQPGNEVSIATIHFFFRHKPAIRSAINNIDESALIDQYGLIAPHRVHRIDQCHVGNGQIHRCRWFGSAARQAYQPKKKQLNEGRAVGRCHVDESPVE